MPSASAVWRPLPLASSTSVPVLLVCMRADTTSYTVNITDTANLWKESLDRKSICRRAWDENTSIDPSDTPENMIQFLTAIKSALDESQPGHERTSISLSSAKGASNGDQGLELKVNCEIPGFATLKWPMQLSKCAPSSIATDFVIPMIQAHHARQREVDSLKRLIAQKDGVLTRVLDKLEATGTTLENVFTALSGKKKISRAAAGDRIKGLSPFDEGKWQAELYRSDGDAEKAGSLLHEVFTGERLQFENAIDFESSPGLDSWWKDFRAVSQPSKDAQSSTSRRSPRASTPTTAPGGGREDEDSFQVQSTPPHLKSASKSTAGTAADVDDTPTASEDDSPSPSESAHPPAERATKSPSPNPKRRVAVMGAIGGKKRATRSPSPPPPAAEKRNPQPAQDDDETASEADEDATASLPDSSPSRPKPPPKKALGPTGVIGQIGGNKAKTKDNENMAAVESKTATKPITMGVIGASERAGGSPSKVETSRDTKEPTETSPERADRKREEIKKELERKAAAGPAKKKRKF